MKRIKLNPLLSAERIGRRVYVFPSHWSAWEGSQFGTIVGRKDVEGVLRGTRRFKRRLGAGGSITYEVTPRNKYIQIGCQKFYLTRVRKLLSLFP